MADREEFWSVFLLLSAVPHWSRKRWAPSATTATRSAVTTLQESSGACQHESSGCWHDENEWWLRDSGARRRKCPLCNKVSPV